jgi:hypothetical protein
MHCQASTWLQSLPQGPAAAALGRDAPLMREAAYRAIGEGFTHVQSHVVFSVWCAVAPIRPCRLSDWPSGALSALQLLAAVELSVWCTQPAAAPS